MKAYIDVVKTEGVITNRTTGATRKILAQVQGKANRRLARIVQQNNSVMEQWIDSPGFKVQVTFEDGTVGVLDCRYLNILEAPKAKVEVVTAA